MAPYRRYLRLIWILLAVMCSGTSHAISFALDSVAEWGKVAKFGVDVYRWGDHFFNGYDSTYVVGTGYKFNVKARSDSWTDYYNFDLPNSVRMRMLSDPSTSVGAYLTYLAVSVGYDRNVSRLFGSNAKARQHFSFGFNCSLFTFNMYYIDNSVGTRISKFGRRGHSYNPHVDFDGANTQSLGLDVYYYFNHKKYSQAAAFNFSRVQVKSQGSFFAGFSFSNNKYKFDFSRLPNEMKETFPDSWINDVYRAKNKNYTLRFGYGYNWAFAKNWLLSFSESPTFGIRNGYINSPDMKNMSFALSNQLKASLVWNHKQWFAGAIGVIDVDILYDKDSTFENAIISGNLSVGYRFNIW